MLNSIPNPKNLSLLLIALAVLLVLPAGSAHAAWPEVEKLLADDGAADDQFGRSVSISGDYAIVGAYADDDIISGADSGSAYIFKRDGTSWTEQAKLSAADGAAYDFFGGSVSISGDYAIVSASRDDDNGSNSGSAYIFYYDGTSWSEQAKLLAADGDTLDNFGKSVSISGDYAIIGAWGDDDNGDYSGSAYIFKRDGTSWSQQAKLLAADGAFDDYFGYSVSISGDYAVVGALGDNSAYIFKRSGTSWSEQAKLTPYGGNFGCSVSISGDFAIVGAYWDDGESGSAYIFKRDGTSWSEQAKLTASDRFSGQHFGYSVSISGDYTIVGALDDNGPTGINPGMGAAYIFTPNDVDPNNWDQVTKLTAPDGANYDWFGNSVSISGDYAVVGSPQDDDKGTNSGSAYIFISSEIHGTKWHDIDGDGRFLEDTDEGERAMQGWLIYIDVNENGQFDAGEPSDLTDANGDYVLNVSAGTWVVAEETRPCWEQTYPGGDGTYSVTLEEDEVAAGYNFGNARPTEIHPSAWDQEEQEKLVASDGAAGDYFGGSVSVSGDYAIVSASGDDDNGSNSGSAYIFAANDINCSDWDQVAKLTADDPAAMDYFGSSVSLSGDYAIVGAWFDDDNGTNSGSAYVFYYDGTSWSQQDKLLASDGAEYDNFGSSVSISGDYAIVGAPYNDDIGSSSGSAYIFKRSGTTWSEQAKLTAADAASNDNFGYSVSVSGDYVIIGAYGDDANGADSGSAYIFKRSGTSWGQQAKLLASDGAGGDEFGWSVSISGDYAIIGADIDESAYIFERSGTSWNEQAKLVASDDGIGYQYFGWSVSISGDYAVIGAHYDNDNGTHSGSAYIFKRDGTSWSEQLKLLAADGAASDEFGNSVSISGDYAIVGAYLDDDSGSNSGSAYMFGKVLCPSMDGTGDCLVNFEDFAIMAGQWLQGTQ